MSDRTIIVGAGLAGLACAVRLREHGVEPLVLESSDAVGGRVRTDVEDGFLLDRGFQVFLSAYPEAGRLLDIGALDLQRFRPGALVHANGKLRRLMDVFRCPGSLLATALQPIGGLRDKLLVGLLRRRALRWTPERIAEHNDQPTSAYLRDFGFSEGMVDRFFRPFYGGIFLERELATSSRMFEFTFAMFAKGFATLPALGMGAIPQQLARRLPDGAVRLRAPVRSVERHAVILDDGQRIEADAVVVATDGETAARLVPELPRRDIEWRSVTCVYFAAPESPLGEAIIALNADPQGLVNNVCVPSDIAPGYAPRGQALISVSVLGVPERSDLESAVQAELRGWFGDRVDAWRHLRTYRISRALPRQDAADSDAVDPAGRHATGGVHVCGDHRSSASIEGAICSGIATAEAACAAMRKESAC